MIYDIEGRAYAKLVDPDGAGFERLPFAWEFPHNVLECAHDLLQRKCRDDDAQVVRLNAVLPPCACPFPDARRRPDLVAVGTEAMKTMLIDVHNRRYRGPDRATTPPPCETAERFAERCMVTMASNAHVNCALVRCDRCGDDGACEQLHRVPRGQAACAYVYGMITLANHLMKMRSVRAPDWSSKCPQNTEALRTLGATIFYMSREAMGMQLSVLAQLLDTAGEDLAEWTPHAQWVAQRRMDTMYSLCHKGVRKRRAHRTKGLMASDLEAEFDAAG
jgi:hypothetical protein